jgi:HD superfamily phosphohydrolase
LSAEPDHEILKDPIYGYIKLYEHEKQIVDTPVFQRLRRTKQLSVVDYVYPGAVHTRFSHSLGVMHVAGVFTQQLLGRAEGISTGEQERCYYLMRLWGLVHDIGHGPFSHLFDEEILATQNSTHEIKGSEIVEQHPDISRVRLPAGITVELLSDMMQSMEEWRNRF